LRRGGKADLTNTVCLHREEEREIREKNHLRGEGPGKKKFEPRHKA